MAIIIPSKNIYEIDNQKIKKNIIDNVTVEQTVISPSNEYDISAFNKTFYNFPLKNVDKLKEKLETDLKLTPSNNDTYGASDEFSACSYVAYNSYKKSSFTLYIPLSQNNKYIQKIYTGKDENGEPKIKYSLSGDLYEGVASSVFTSSQGDVFGLNIQPINYEEPKITKQVILNIPREIQNIKEMTYGTFDPKKSIADAKVDFENEGTIFFPKVEIITADKDYYKVEIDFYSSVRTVVMQGEYLQKWGEARPNVSMQGLYKTYIPTAIEITVNGDVIGIDLTDGSDSVKVGSGNKPYSLSGNELLQDSGKVGETPLTKHLANNVLNHYVNGKETATLLCDINEYHRQKDNYVFNPSSYNDIRNATYNNDNGIVKQINKDYEFTESVEVDGFYDLGGSDNYIFYSPLEGLQLVDSYSTTEIDSGYLTTITFKLKNSNGQLATLERDLNINFSEDSSITMENPVTISKGKSEVVFTCATSNEELVFSPTNQVFSMISKITLSGGKTYPQTINKFALYYDDNIIKEWDITTPQKLEFEFEKTNSNRNIIKFVALGKNIDTFISYWGWWLEYRVPYKFSVNVTNITNGEVSWKDIKIESTVNDTLAISTKDKSKPMTFEIGDEVIPMVYTANGIDEPMSKKKDNSPKVFRIVGKEIIYDGAVWQKIYSQEK